MKCLAEHSLSLLLDSHNARYDRSLCCLTVAPSLSLSCTMVQSRFMSHLCDLGFDFNFSNLWINAWTRRYEPVIVCCLLKQCMKEKKKKGESMWSCRWMGHSLWILGTILLFWSRWESSKYFLLCVFVELLITFK